MVRRTLFFYVPLLFLAAGCASTNPTGSFADAARPVAERTALEPSWPRDAAAQSELSTRVDALLSQPLDPDRAAQIALWRNPELLAELEELGISQADYAQATRIANPSLDFFYRRPDRSGLVPNVEIGLIENLLDPLLLPLRKRMAAAELEAAKLRVGQRMLDRVAETKQAVVSLQAANRLADRLGEIVEVEGTAAEFAGRQRAAGNLSELALEEQLALFDETKIERAHAEVAATAAREALQRSMGLSGDEEAWTVVPAQIDPPGTEGGTSDREGDADFDVQALQTTALAGRLDISAARAGVGIIDRALALRRGGRFLPGGIKVGVSRERDPDRVRVTGPVLGLELPIFDTGAASIAKLQSEKRRAERQVEALSVRVASEVRESAFRFAAARDLARSYRDTVLPRRARILDQTLRHFNAMLVGVYDVLLAKRMEIESEKAAIEAWRDAWIARFALEHAVGGKLPNANPSNPTQTPEPAGGYR